MSAPLPQETYKGDAHLALPGGDDGVTGNELGEDTAGGLDTEGEGADIDEDDVGGAFSAGEDTTLDGSTVGDGLIGVDTLGGLLAAEVLLEELLDLGDTGRTTDEDDLERQSAFECSAGNGYSTDLIDILLLDVGILEHLLDGLHGLTEEIHVQLLELGTSNSLREVVSVLEALNLDPGALLGGQGPLRLLDLPLEFAEGAQVAVDVGAGLLLVRLDEVLHNPVVEIFTTEMGVTGGGQDLEDTVVDGEERDIEGSSSEIVDDDLGLSTLFVKSVGDSGGGRLVDDTEDSQTGDSAGVLGRLTLSVVEVWWPLISIGWRSNTKKCSQAGTVTTAWVTFSPR